MSKNNDILNDVEFWLSLSERYFEADTSIDEERALMRFVTSPYACDDKIEDSAKEVFQEVLATMSLTSMAIDKSGSDSLNDGLEALTVSDKKEKTDYQSILKRVAGCAAVLLLAFIINGIFEADNSNGYLDVCMAYDNGVLITDKEKVFSMMRDSWDNIDFQTSSTEVMEIQLKEMFDVLK